MNKLAFMALASMALVGCAKKISNADLFATCSAVCSDKPVGQIMLEGNRFSLNLGCNSMFGSFNMVDDDQISFSNVASTKMACSPDDEKLEREFLAALAKSPNFKLERFKDAKLRLSSGDFKVVLEQSSH